MGQLADRLRVVLREHGFEPEARASELAALASLEAHDPKAAHARFLELKRLFAAQRRADLLAQLRAHAFVRDVPPSDAAGYSMKDVEADVRDAARALALARAAAAALDEEARARSALRDRALAPPVPLEPAAWTALRPLAEAAEARRRAALRELRVEARWLDAARRGAKAGVPVPPMHDRPAAEADAALEGVEARIAAAEALADARERALRPLRDPAVRAWRRDSARKLEREVEAASDVAPLAALEARAAALREEAAALGRDAARARRSGKAPPARERRAGDAMDPYG